MSIRFPAGALAALAVTFACAVPAATASPHRALRPLGLAAPDARSAAQAPGDPAPACV